MITCMDFVATSTVPTVPLKSPSTHCNAPCTVHGSVSTISKYHYNVLFHPSLLPLPIMFLAHVATLSSMHHNSVSCMA